MLFGGAVAIASLTAIVAFVQKCIAFKREMNAVLEGVGDGSQFKTFTDETGEQLQTLFAKVPALAFCFQTYFQALIPPQPPYDTYYRSGREALFAFDKDFILKTTLGLRLFQAVPAILISMGALGTIMGFAASLSSTQSLLAASAGSDNLTELARQLFEIGGKSFWPAGIGLLGGIALLIIERILTTQCSDMIQALCMVMDAGMAPRTIEQIASTSLTELRQTHKALTEFTKSYVTNLNSSLSKALSKGGQLTMEDLLEQKAKEFVVPVNEEIRAFRAEAQKAAESTFKLVADKSLALENRLMDSVDSLKSVVSKLQDALLKTGDSVSRDSSSKLEWVVSEIQALSQARDNWSQESIQSMLLAINNVTAAVRGDLGSFSEQVHHNLAGMDLPGMKKDLVFELASRLTAQAEVTQNILLELRDSATLMSADIHQAARVLEEQMAPDLGRHSKLLQEVTDRIGMQGNRLTETILSVGEDLAHRVDLVSTVLVGDEPTSKDESSPFLSEVREKLTQFSPNNTYGAMRERIAQLNVDRRIKEGESQRASDRAEAESQTRVVSRSGLFERIGELESQIRTQKDELAQNTNSLGESIGEKLSSQGEVVRDGLGKSTLKLHNDVAYLAQKIDTIAEKLEARLEKIGSHVGKNIAEFGDRVNDELMIIGEDVDVLAHELGKRKLDKIAAGLQDLGDYLEDLPLSTIQVSQGRPRRTSSSQRESDDRYEEGYDRGDQDDYDDRGQGSAPRRSLRRPVAQRRNSSGRSQTRRRSRSAS
jgi:hypothetical protein